MQETRPVTTSSGKPVRQPSGTSEPAQKPKLLDRLPEALRSRHYSRRRVAPVCNGEGYDMPVICTPEELMGE